MTTDIKPAAFTREDVRFLRFDAAQHGSNPALTVQRDFLNDLADRIETHLPPEK